MTAEELENVYDQALGNLEINSSENIFILNGDDVLATLHQMNILHELDVEQINSIIEYLRKKFNIEDWMEYIICHINCYEDLTKGTFGADKDPLEHF